MILRLKTSPYAEQHHPELPTSIVMVFPLVTPIPNSGDPGGNEVVRWTITGCVGCQPNTDAKYGNAAFRTSSRTRF
jgi:hypothetical protein